MIARCLSELHPLFRYLPRDLWNTLEGLVENAAKLDGYFNVTHPGWKELALAQQPTPARSLTYLESAVAQSAAMIDLLMAKIVEEDRAGAIEYNQSGWVGDLAYLAAEVRVNLQSTFSDCYKSKSRA